MGAISELIRDQERDAATITWYTKESSGLGELCNAFPPLGEKDLVQWLYEFGKSGNARILEFGGGAKQVAALQVLRIVSRIERYVGYEINELSIAAKYDLSSFPQYENIRGGLGDFDALLNAEGGFDIAFAHNVVEHLPHPFLLLRKMHGKLRNGGVLFVNGIYVYQDVAQDLFAEWKNGGYEFQHSLGLVDTGEQRSGIVRVNIALKKTTNKLLTPIPTSELLRDYLGGIRPTVVYSAPRFPDRAIMQ